MIPSSDREIVIGAVDHDDGQLLEVQREAAHLADGDPAAFGGHDQHTGSLQGGYPGVQVLVGGGGSGGQGEWRDRQENAPGLGSQDLVVVRDLTNAPVSGRLDLVELVQFQ